MSKTLVAYFSCTGNTKKLAEAINEIVEGDIYEIVPKVSYTDKDLDYMDKNSRTTIEMNDKNSRPEIGNKLNNIEDYEKIYLGFPIWWYTAPRIINTFLESYDFSGKIIIPFATSGSSGIGNTTNDLKEIVSKDTIVKEGKVLSLNSKEEINEWIRGFDKV